MTGWKLRKIISGGQTGVDQAALEVARYLGYATGGWMPAGYRTEDGNRPDLAQLYGLEVTSSTNYIERTIINVRRSDLTVWFGTTTSAGHACTHNAALAHRRQMLINPHIDTLIAAIKFQGVEVLNVAGNRLSVNPDAAETARTVLMLLPSGRPPTVTRALGI